MKILITGQSALSENDGARMEEYLRRVLHDDDVEEVIFAASGFAGTFNGMTCVATAQSTLNPSISRAFLYATALAPAGGPKLSVVVQHRQADLPDAILQRAAGVYEYAFGSGYNPGYVRYVERFPELVEGCGQVTVFWDGNFVREAWDVVRGLRARTLRGAYIDFEIIALEGPPAVVQEVSREKREPKKGRA